MKLLSNKKENIAAIEIGREWVKFALAEKLHGSKKLDRLEAKDIKGLSDELVSQVIKEFCEAQELSHYYFITVIPRQFVTIRNLNLPSTKPEEIKDIIDLQAGRQTPYLSNEIVVDYRILSNQKEGYTRVLVAIVHRNIIRRCLDILKRADIIPKKVVLSSEGVANWILACLGRDSAFGGIKTTEDEPFVLIDVDSNSIDFGIVSGDKIIFTRSIPAGAEQIASDPDKARDKFLSEIKHSFNIYQNEEIGKDTDKIILTGAEDGLSDLENILKAEFKSVQVLNYQNFKELHIGTFIYDTPASKKVSFCGVMGLALKPEGAHIDLLPKEIKAERIKEIKRHQFILTGSLIGFIFVAGLGISLEKIYAKSQYLNWLNVQSHKTQIESREVGTTLAKVNIIKDYLNTEDSALDILYEVHRLVPAQIYLTSTIFDRKNRKFSLRGTSNTMSEVFDFVKILEDSDCFENVKTKYTTKRKLEGKELTDFELICQIE